MAVLSQVRWKNLRRSGSLVAAIVRRITARGGSTGNDVDDGDEEEGFMAPAAEVVVTGKIVVAKEGSG